LSLSELEHIARERRLIAAAGVPDPFSGALRAGLATKNVG
jgi:hypothetical protein